MPQGWRSGVRSRRDGSATGREIDHRGAGKEARDRLSSVKPGRSIRGAVALALAAGALAAACSLALDFNGIDDGTRDAATVSDSAALDAGSTVPGSPDAEPDGAPLSVDATADGSVLDSSTAVDASGGADASLDASSSGLIDGPCGAFPGPAMTLIDTYCIDSTEITVAQYSAFLAARAGVVGTQIALCSWNNSLVPGSGVPSGTPNAPITGVNWCQAYLYCAWAGKELCGAPDGGIGDPNRWTDPVDSEWFHACSRNNDGLHDYPYGNTYAPATCNGADYGADAALPSVASCVGGYPGVFDLSGNVWEWENRCFPAGDAGLVGEGDFCFTRGGSFTETSANLTCGVGIGYSRESQANNIGFRCCAL